MHTEEMSHRGFVVSWPEPPLDTARWTANVASVSANLNALMEQRGAKVIEGRTREEMIARAKSYIDGLLDS